MIKIVRVEIGITNLYLYQLVDGVNNSGFRVCNNKLKGGDRSDITIKKFI